MGKIIPRPLALPYLRSSFSFSLSPLALSRFCMKQPPEINQLCLSCRRSCKQAVSVLIAACPRYYQGPKIKRVEWKQPSLPLE
jgi:hypothetical protein